MSGDFAIIFLVFNLTAQKGRVGNLGVKTV